MQISVTELVSVLVIYTAMTGSGMYWLWHRALTQRARAGRAFRRSGRGSRAQSRARC